MGLASLVGDENADAVSANLDVVAIAVALDHAHSLALDVRCQQRQQVPFLPITNGLYSISIEMRDGLRGRATGVIVLRDGHILGGDSHFYYTGSFTCDGGKWHGELITHQHTPAVGVNLVFGGRDVSCSFSGTYGEGAAEVFGTALVGKTSVSFRAALAIMVED